MNGHAIFSGGQPLRQLPVDDELRERTAHGTKAWPIQYYVDRLHCFENQEITLHWHHELEFWMVFSGMAEVCAASHTFHLFPGEGIFINSNVFHSFRRIGPAGPCDCPNIVFSEELLSYAGSLIADRYVTPVLLEKKLPFLLLKKGNPWQEHMLSCLDRIFSLMQRYGTAGPYGPLPLLDFSSKDLISSCYELEVQSLLASLWADLFSHRRECELSEPVTDDTESRIRMQNMLTFIQNNYQRPLTLEMVSRSASISKSECSRCFHHYFKTAPMEYVTDYRIKRAKHALRSTNKKLEQIASENGFSSSAYFCRVFKNKTGTTPNAYKNQKKGLISNES